MSGYDPWGIDDEATIARIERYEAACIDGEITAEDLAPEEGEDA